MRKMIGRLHRSERGMVGLQAAIILIAFVVVASVFSYAVLTAGWVATDQAQGVINEGLDKTQGTLEVRGAVIAREDTLIDGEVNYVEFTVSPAIAGGAIAVTTSNTSITYYDTAQKIDNLVFTTTMIVDVDSDTVLDGGDQMLISVNVGDGTATVAPATPLTSALGASTSFTLEVKPPSGGLLKIARTTPVAIDVVNDLY